MGRHYSAWVDDTTRDVTVTKGKVYSDAAVRSQSEQPPNPATQIERYRAMRDSGMVTAYRPTQHTKNTGVINSIQTKWTNLVRHISSILTTQQGSAVAAPSAYAFQLYSLRYEHRQVVDDCRLMYDNDVRVRRSINMFAREAVRRGVIVTVQNGARGLVGSNQRKAQKICSDIEKIFNGKEQGSPKIESFSRMAIVEGDLFLQYVVNPATNEVVDIMRMPASSMERNTDDADKFIDVERAFSNVDTLTNAEIATFALWQIWHGRWDYIDGDKYGNPIMLASRRLYRLLELAEEAQLRRRISRAPQRILWNIGTESKPGLKADVDKWKENNGEVEGLQEQYDPVNVGWNFFGNGLITASVIKGDSTVHEIDDVEYFQDQFVNAGLPTPGAIYSLASKDVNRDVLEDVKAQWLQETMALSEFMAGAVRKAIDLGLLLAGINPDSINVSIHFSESSIETPASIIARAQALLNNGYGQGLNFQWLPLITWDRAVMLISEFADIDDVNAEMALLKAFKEQQQNSGVSPPGMLAKNAIVGEDGMGNPTHIVKRVAPKRKVDDVDTTTTNGNGYYPDQSPYARNKKTPGGAYTGNGALSEEFYSTYGEPNSGEIEY